jgi:hypothetical protein
MIAPAHHPSISVLQITIALIKVPIRSPRVNVVSTIWQVKSGGSVAASRNANGVIAALSIDETDWGSSLAFGRWRKQRWCTAIEVLDVPVYIWDWCRGWGAYKVRAEGESFVPLVSNNWFPLKSNRIEIIIGFCSCLWWSSDDAICDIWY